MDAFFLNLYIFFLAVEGRGGKTSDMSPVSLLLEANVKAGFGEGETVVL